MDIYPSTPIKIYEHFVSDNRFVSDIYLKSFGKTSHFQNFAVSRNHFHYSIVVAVLSPVYHGVFCNFILYLKSYLDCTIILTNLGTHATCTVWETRWLLTLRCFHLYSRKTLWPYLCVRSGGKLIKDLHFYFVLTYDC